jgi:hypothetical protein
MKHIKKVLLLLSLMFSVIIGVNNVKANELKFSVNPILPENQVNPQVGYYNLLLNPGQKQTLKVELANQTSKDVTVDVSISSATTNINGVVEYSPNDIKPDSTLKYNLKDYAKTPSKVEIPSKSTKTIEVNVTMPAENFSGIMAGGITFKEDEGSPQAKDSKSSGITIQNKYQFVVGLLMQQNKDVVAPTLQMNSVTPAQVNYRNVINANFQNTAKGFLNDMAVDAQVTHEGNSEVLYKTQKDSMTMAPNTNFDFPLPLEGQRFQPGRYTYTADVYGLKSTNGEFVFGKDNEGKPQHYTYHWKFVKNYTIDGNKASSLNSKDVTVKPDNNWIYWLIAILLFILLVLSFLFVILWKRRKKEEEDDDKII